MDAFQSNALTSFGWVLQIALKSVAYTTPIIPPFYFEYLIITSTRQVLYHFMTLSSVLKMFIEMHDRSNLVH
jgi:hypothetical protein